MPLSIRPDSDVVELAKRLIAIPSVNPMGWPIGPAARQSIYFEHRVTDFLEAFFRQTHIETERIPVLPPQDHWPSRDNLLARIPGRDGGPIVLLEVHQDTVPVSGMTIDPFAAQVAEEKIFGRGACDVKGGMACLMATAMHLSKLPRSSRPHLVLAFTINEEFGFSGAMRLREAWELGTSRLLPSPPDSIIVTEPTEQNVIVAHKGVVRWRCRTRGKAAHSSAPQKGENAIYRMATVVSELEQYAGHIVGGLANHPLVGRPTLNVGTIEGGLSVNTVPDKCHIHIDRRLCPGEDPQAARQHVIDHLMSCDRHAWLEHEPPDIQSIGLDSTHNQLLAQAVLRAAGGGSKILGVPFGTDAAILAATGIPTIVFGPGSIDQAHTADEWVAIDQLHASCDTLKAFLRNISLVTRGDQR